MKTTMKMIAATAIALSASFHASAQMEMATGPFNDGFTAGGSAVNPLIVQGTTIGIPLAGAGTATLLPLAGGLQSASQFDNALLTLVFEGFAAQDPDGVMRGANQLAV